MNTITKNARIRIKWKNIAQSAKKTLKITRKEVYVNRKGTLFYTLLMILFLLMMTAMYSPELFGQMQDLYASLPPAILEMIGGQLALGEFGGFISTYIFSFCWMYLGIYVMLKSSQDIPKEIDYKTIDLILSKPIKRGEFVWGKYLHHVIIALLITGGVSIGLFIGIFLFPNINPAEVYLDEIIVVIAWLFCFLVALASTGFLFSTFLNTRMALATSFGLMIFFYMIGSFSGLLPEAAQGIKYISIFYYFRPSEMLIDHTLDLVWIHILILIIYSLVIVIIATIIFSRRDIPV